MIEELKVIISAEIADMKKQVEAAKKELEDFKNTGNESGNKVGESLASAGKAAGIGLAAVGAGVVAAGFALNSLVDSTKEYRAEQAKLNAAFTAAGGSVSVAKTTYNDLFRVLGDSGQATEAAQHLAKLTTEEKALSEWTNICQGVYATFGNSLPIESLTEAVNHSAKLGEVQGSLADALEWSGISVDEFNDQLFLCNSESERERLIRETLNGKYASAAGLYEETAGGIMAANEAQTKMNDAMSAMAEAVEPINTMLTELGADVLSALTPYVQSFAENYLPAIKDALGEAGEKLQGMIKWMAEYKDYLATLAVAIGIIVAAIGLYNTVTAIKTAMDVAQVATIGGLVAAHIAQAAAATVALAPYIAIVAAIAAVIAIIVLCIKHWDDITAAVKKFFEKAVAWVKEAAEKVAGFFKGVIDWIKNNWQGLLLLLVNPFVGGFKLLYDNCDGFRKFIDNFLAKIKNAIKSGFDWIGNKISAAKDKIKSIIDTIKGLFNFKFEWPKLKMPSIGVAWKNSPAWMAEAAKFLGMKGVPSFSVSWNALGGVFDKPTVFGYGDSLQGIGEAGAEAVVPLENNLGWLDKLAGMLSSRMGGGTPVVLQVDGKTLARTTIGAINDLTRQQGKLSLNIV